MKFIKRHKQIIIFLTLTSLFIIPVIVWGADAKSPFISDNCLAHEAENCGLKDLLLLFVNAYSFSLKYLGSLALLLFVIGGIMFMTSGGNQERVTKAKNLLVGTVIGLIIVMVSYLWIHSIQKLWGLKSEYRVQEKTTKTNQ